MSLINDALKRAKQAQQAAQPVSELPTHVPPIEPAQHARHSLALILPAMLAVAAMLILFVIWQAAQRSRPAEANQAGRQTEVTANTRAALPPASPSEPTSTKTAQPNPPPAVNKVASVITEPGELATKNSALSGNPGNANTNSANAPAEAIIPKPAPLRLQAIVFDPTRPSAMIGGKTLFIGDKLGELRVIAIDRESATLAGAGQTNVLALPEQ